MLLTQVALLDELLDVHAVVLGGDFTAYRNHAYRVLNICAAQFAGDAAQLEKTAIAAACHDLGIWTDATFDYLQPSVRLATAHLVRTRRSDWTPEITAMIREHHKLSRYRGNAGWLVEPFRRADWADVSRGLITYGLPRTLLREVFSTWPNAGFHRRLAQLALQRVRSHPLSPLPMVRV